MFRQLDSLLFIHYSRFYRLSNDGATILEQQKEQNIKAKEYSSIKRNLIIIIIHYDY